MLCAAPTSRFLQGAEASAIKTYSRRRGWWAPCTFCWKIHPPLRRLALSVTTFVNTSSFLKVNWTTQTQPSGSPSPQTGFSSGFADEWPWMIRSRWKRAGQNRSSKGPAASSLMFGGKSALGPWERLIASPFWIFFGISFSFLAILFGVFDRSIINIVFASLFYFAAGVTGMLIYAASDPYHDPGKVSSAPLTKLKERMDATSGTPSSGAPGDPANHWAPGRETGR